VRILFVDNHPAFTATVVATFLSNHEVVIVPTVAGARRALDGTGEALVTPFDAVLVDYDLDDGKGDDLVRWIRSSADGTTTLMRCIPIVAVSARDEGNTALVAAGADAACGKLAFATIESVLATMTVKVE